MVYIGSTGHILNFQKIPKFQDFILVPGIQKNDFPDFSGFFYEKSPEIEYRIFSGDRNLVGLLSRVRRPGNCE